MTEGIVQQPEPEYALQASRTREEIENELLAIQTHEHALAHGYVKLGGFLAHARQEKYWIPWGFKSWGAYILSIRDKVEKGRSRIYQIIGVVETLLPEVGEEALNQMGISKALELKRLKTAKPDTVLTPELVAKATDDKTTIEDLRKEIFERHDVAPESCGTYRDLGFFYATAAEWEEFQRGYNLAARVGDPVPAAAPDWLRTKIIQQKLVAEFLATYEAADFENKS